MAENSWDSWLSSSRGENRIQLALNSRRDVLQRIEEVRSRFGALRALIIENPAQMQRAR